MSRQDKAITERNAKTLRELLKRPENKVCADCKRNDPRWASWNLGVFLCIRCSGIHRSMGTHISRVKSVDLDVWTPEQMASIQKWGNRRANLYWEAHLRAGHIPPDHKMDSFIRSKYESRRWAREGPPPEDPSVLETDAPPVPATQQAQSPTSPMSHTPRSSLTIRQPQPHQLLSTGIANRAHQAVPHPSAPAQQPPAPQPQPATTTNELFSLDFHPPASTPSNASSEALKKDIKQDILSLFSMPAQSTPSQPVQNTFGQFRGGVQPQAGWGQLDAQAVPPQTSMMGNAGVGLWGATSGWNAAPAVPAQPSLWANTATLAAAAPTQPNSSGNAAIPAATAPTQSNSWSNAVTPPATAPAQQNMWGDAASPAASVSAQQNMWSSAATPVVPAQQQSFFTTSDVWNSSSGPTAAAGTAVNSAGLFDSSLPGMQKKDDVFGDIWGGFK